MATSNTTNLSGAPQHSNNYNALRKKINDIVKNFDVLPPKRKVTRHIFKWGLLYIFISYLLYFIAGALFFTRLCQLYGPKLRHIYPDNYSCGKTIPEPSFPEQLVNLIIGYTKLATGSIEIVLLVIGAILLLSFFNIWRGYVPKTLRDLFNNKRLGAVRIDDNWKHADTAIAAHYLLFLDRYKCALSGRISYLFGFCGILYTICYTAILSKIDHHQTIDYLKSLVLPQSHVDAFVLLLFLFSLVFFAVIEIILFYSFGTILFIIIVSGKYLGELVRDFHITSNPLHLDRCGGLKQLGKFCQWLFLPTWSFSLFLLVTVILLLVSGYKTGGNMKTLCIINFWFILLVCGFASFLVVWAATIPLWKIHMGMIDTGEISQQKQSTEINIIEKRLQNLIDRDQLEQAKAVKEKLELAKTLNTSYPKWPFITFKASALSISTSIISSSVPVVLRLFTEPAVLNLLQRQL